MLGQYYDVPRNGNFITELWHNNSRVSPNPTTLGNWNK